MRKINRRNFLKAAGVLSAAVAGSLLAGCGGSDTGAGAAASDLPAYNELTVGTDHTDLTATIKVINHRSDLIQEGTFDGYVAEFQKLYPNITIEYEGITDYAGDMTTRLTSQEWGDVCMIPTTIPLTELGDYFYPMCDLSGIQEDYNFAANRAYDGKVYGIPSTGNAQGVIYNKRIFEEVGITSLPKTPTEFLDALQKIRDYDLSIDPLYTNYAAGWTMSAWDAYIGGGATPIETSDGWLLFYHGVTGTCNGYVYSIGGAILDRDEPSRVLHRCSTFLLTPETDYEERGFVPNVCFPCATLQDAVTGRIALYYGCADSYVGLAFTTVDEVTDYIKAHDETSCADRELGLR